MSDIAIFCLTALILLVAPGPTNALLALSGATVGAHRSLPVLVSAIAGYGATVIAIKTAFGSMIASSTAAQNALRIAAALYLAFLAASLWRATRTESAAAVTRGRAFFITCTNPKSFVLALVAVPIQGPSSLLSLAALPVIAAIACSAWILLGSVVARAGGGRFVNVVPKVASVALVTFATMLMASAMLTGS